MTLPPEIAAEVRRLVLSGLAQHAVTRAEFFEALAALAPPLAPEDVAAAELVLPPLLALRPATWVAAHEVVALALSDRTDAGLQLRRGLAPCLAGAAPARSVGRLLTRLSRRPVAGVFLRRVDPPHRRDAALYMPVTAG